MSSEKNLNYQQAIERLETILRDVDNTNLGIDELAAQVQEATDLLKTCRTILMDTEKNVQQALGDLDEAFDASTPGQ